MSIAVLMRDELRRLASAARDGEQTRRLMAKTGRMQRLLA